MLKPLDMLCASGIELCRGRVFEKNGTWKLLSKDPYSCEECNSKGPREIRHMQDSTTLDSFQRMTCNGSWTPTGNGWTVTPDSPAFCGSCNSQWKHMLEVLIKTRPLHCEDYKNPQEAYVSVKPGGFSMTNDI